MEVILRIARYWGCDVIVENDKSGKVVKSIKIVL